MGTYIQSGEEIVEKFEKFLEDASSGEGDIPASTVAEAWNMVAKKQGWDDRLVAIDEISELKDPELPEGYGEEEDSELDMGGQDGKEERN